MSESKQNGELLLRMLRNAASLYTNSSIVQNSTDVARNYTNSSSTATNLTTTPHFTFGAEKSQQLDGGASDEIEFGGTTYVIVLLSVLVLLAILFTLCGLFHKAEAHSKADLDDSLLFDIRHHDLITSYFDAPSTTSLI